MKILHIVPSISPVRGGVSQAVLELVKALRDAQIDAEIATTNDNGADLLDVPLGKRLDYKQVPVRFFPRFSPPLPAVREFALSHPLTTWLWQHLAEYDLLHVHALFSYPSTVAMAIARLQNRPYVVSPHGLLCTWSLQQSTLKKRLFLTLIERANLNQAQAISYTILKEQQEAIPLGLKPTNYLLPLGLYLPQIIPEARLRLRQWLQIPETEFVILFMSRLHYKKGLDYLIPALGKIAHQRFTFVIAGSGTPEYEAEIETLLMQAGIANRTYRPGFVTGELKALLLQGADLFTLTSHSENFGVAVLEALAVGLPVVVTPGVALASVVQQHELGYVPELDVNAIASAIQSCLNHPETLKEMSDRARQVVVKEYTWDCIATQLLKIYQLIHHSHETPMSC